jgi:hypothetical protein
MASVAVSKPGCTELFFIELSVKVNGAYYWDVLLKQDVASDQTCRETSSWTAHRAWDMVELPHRETPEFIGPDLWPANPPDLDSVDAGSGV